MSDYSNKLDKAQTEIVGLNTKLDNEKQKVSESAQSLNGLQLDFDKLKAENEALRSNIDQLYVDNEKLQQLINEQSTKLEMQDKSTDKPLATKIHGKVAYLTFDDGPSVNTVKILDILKEHNIKATFFVNANNTQFGKEVYKRIVDEGHVIGNHTYSHDYNSIYKSPEAFEADFNKLQKLLKDVTGVEPTIMRFPGGSNNHSSWPVGGKNIMKSITQHMADLGYVYFDWTISSTDAARVVQDRSTIIDQVLQNSKKQKQAIILMHDSKVKTTTVEALPDVIKGLEAQGFSFDTLSPNIPPTQFLKPQK